ncbi:zinc-dependent alcohol dehydrogenase family protein [Sagittula sp. S175]|uniref:zinc-dependent alcohol dehydrogenase family protein n=1 Tax=Sagittula sp. S175 TaxID=3415129 RepID=UPI003C7E2183
MKALIYNGVGQKEWVDKPMPTLRDATDVIVKLTATTICGTDLHILKGDVPTVAPGITLGHEGVGVVEAVGPAIRGFKPGDRVLIACITACGSCRNCRKGMHAHCTDGGGWQLGHMIDGTQAEYVRIPHGDFSLHRIPEGMDEEALVMLSDILPTGFEIGVLSGKVTPGDTVAIVGAGPVGMAALLTAQFYAPARIIMVDMDPKRLAMARQFGASDTIDVSEGNAAEAIMAMTDGVGVDVAMEAVGIPKTFELCQDIIAPGGRIANIGVHGTKVDLALEKLWIRNISISMGLVNTDTMQ